MKNDNFVSTQREEQRNWVLQRTLDELVDDLLHLDKIAQRFVPGSRRPLIQHDLRGSSADHSSSQLVIEGQQVMQDWERPLMKAMADIATESHGDVLEVGFGMGISATFIQESGVKSHTIVECNSDVVQVFEKWQQEYSDRNIRLIYGQWQDILPELGTYDSILFDTYPLSEEEFKHNVLNSITYAEHFMPTAVNCLNPKGVFTYYTNEIDSYSRRHQRLVLKYFKSLTLSVVNHLSPPEDCNYWWADSMVVVKAIK